jgi:RND family efflux transporter MFP subunit
MNNASAALAGDIDNSFSTRVPGSAPAETFCATWLAHQCELIGAVKAASVLIGDPDTGPYREKASWPAGHEFGKELHSSAEQALRERSALIIQRKSRGGSSSATTDYYDVAYPIVIGSQLFGAVVLRLTSPSSASLKTALEQLSWGAAWLEVMLHRENSAQTTLRNERLKAVLDTLSTVLEWDEFHKAATALVTDLATRLVCERVSLGFRVGDRVRLEAISHSSRFGKRTNLSRAIEAAMDEASDQEVLICYPNGSGEPFQITQCHEELARRHGSTAVCSVPLGRDGEIYGVLTFERLADHPFDAATVEFCQAVAALAGPIFELKKRDERSFANVATARLRARLNTVFGPGHVAIKLGCIVAAGLAIFLTFANGNYRVPAKMLIEAQSQRVAVAPFNGYIATARVRPGDVVRSGEILATLDDRDLKLERLKWSSQKEQYAKQYNLAMAQHNAAQVKITAAQVAQADAELALIEDQLARAHVLAPIDGVVVSGDLSQSVGAPAERGQVLFEVAPLSAYRVVLQVDERDAAEVVVGQRGKLALSAFPTRPLPFTVQKITPVSAAREGRNYFRVEATMEHAPPQLRPGMEGVGKIEIGERRLIWIWTHGAVDWLRLIIWSWLP